MTHAMIHAKTILLFLVITLGIALTPHSNNTNADQKQWHSLFNGDNLEGWETYLAKPDKSLDVEGLPRNADGTYKKPYGVNTDPLGVFSVVTEDDEPAIRISGQVFGALTTKDSWENYHLQLQFKWGEAQWPPRKNAKRDTGLLYYAFGEHGGADNSWMKSQEFQIQHTDVGDYWGVGGGAMDIPAKKTSDNEAYIYDPQPRLFRLEKDWKPAGIARRQRTMKNRMDSGIPSIFMLTATRPYT